MTPQSTLTQSPPADPVLAPDLTRAKRILKRKETATPDAMRSVAARLEELGETDCARDLRVRADEDEAIGILGGIEASHQHMFDLARRLGSHKRFGLARRLMDRASDAKKDADPDLYLRIFQKRALFTYKDPDLPTDWRLDRALQILRTPESLTETTDQETLGLAGAIYKRKWELDGQRQNLERALSFYLKGYAQGAATEAQRADILAHLRRDPTCVVSGRDRGYNAINAAFLLDLLAAHEEEVAARAGVPSMTSERRREDARLIREEIVRSVPPLVEGEPLNAREWWSYATIGEALFGLDRYAEALEWLARRPRRESLFIPEWEYESTAVQLARLARAKHPRLTEDQLRESVAGRTLAEFLGDDHDAVATVLRGKFGLALSGGGFRASLYHIGTLAALAELDVLRHVEVISCVSGGSIIGAHYYLELRRLLREKRDVEIGREDYIEIVRRIEHDFVAGVQRNIRMRVLAELSTNLRMIFSPGYSRTMRVGELYERELFSRVQDGEGRIEGYHWVPDWLARTIGWKRQPRWLDELLIEPRIGPNEWQTGFRPQRHNWRRRNKVPVLILNATSLNTGHGWQFTASFMGEPPMPIQAEIDGNDRLRRMYYSDAPDGFKKFRLGYAVAASSCVPGLFEPLILDGLYPGRSVRLVDGGVCDNQGIAGLIEQDCTVPLVSDGSGQMANQETPGTGPISVLFRSNNVSMARVREAQYTDMRARRRSLLLNGFLFVHLKQDLPGKSVPWERCPAYLRASEFEEKAHAEKDVTGYGVPVELQRRLAAIRTDLDSFSDAEALALMNSAYRMTIQQFTGDEPSVQGFSLPQERVRWRFQELDRCLVPDAPPHRHLEELLRASDRTFFKVWQQSAVLRAVKWGAALGLLALLVWYGITHADANLLPRSTYAWMQANLSVGAVGWTLVRVIGFALLASLVVGAIGKRLGKTAIRLVRWRDTLRRIGFGIVMSVVGWLVARVHLHLFDRLYLRLGALGRIPHSGR